MARHRYTTAFIYSFSPTTVRSDPSCAVQYRQHRRQWSALHATTASHNRPRKYRQGRVSIAHRPRSQHLRRSRHHRHLYLCLLLTQRPRQRRSASGKSRLSQLSPTHSLSPPPPLMRTNLCQLLPLLVRAHRLHLRLQQYAPTFAPCSLLIDALLFVKVFFF